jgi:hypothetical protein
LRDCLILCIKSFITFSSLFFFQFLDLNFSLFCFKK